jgi:hypothetical protein
MAYNMRMRYVGEESVPASFWRALSLAIGVHGANEALNSHLLCQECHPSHHYDLYSKKALLKPPF